MFLYTFTSEGAHFFRVSSRMLPPVRCFTCGKVMPYRAIETDCASGMTHKEAMEKEGLHRVCCRRMILCVAHELEDFMSSQAPDVEDSAVCSFLNSSDVVCEESTD